MSNPGSRFRIALFAASALGIIPSVAIAQPRVPARAGNIWGGMNHEPVPARVMRDETAAGIAPSRAAEEKTANDVENLYRQLMGEEADR